MTGLSALFASWNERVRAALRAAGTPDIEAPSGALERLKMRRGFNDHRDDFFVTGAARLAEYRCADDARGVLELHVGGMPARAVARAVGRNRKFVDRVIRDYKLWLCGKAPRGPGRPRRPDGHDRESVVVPGVRLDEELAERFLTMADRLGVTPYEAARLAIRAQTSEFFGFVRARNPGASGGRSSQG